MIQASITSPDLMRQIDYLKAYPDISDRFYRPVMSTSVKGLASAILPNIPVRTGRARSDFGSKVTGKGIKMTGRVGWYDKGDVWYPNVLEHGAVEHSIVPSKARMLAFEGSSGTVFTAHVRHPGLRPLGFMKSGFDRLKPMIEQLFAGAAEQIVNSMKVK